MTSVEKRDCQGSRRKYCLALYSIVPSLTYPLMFLKYARRISASEPWHFLFPLHGMLSPQRATCLTLTLRSDDLKVPLSVTPVLIILSCLQHHLPHYLLLFSSQPLSSEIPGLTSLSLYCLPQPTIRARPYSLVHYYIRSL